MTKILIGKSNVDLDYPTCRPALDLDFTQEVLDERITFTRATSGTRVNKFGLIETVPANQPRFDYDPVTKKCKGLLIEDGTANNFFASDRVDANWLITVSGGSGTFIDGERVTSSVLAVDAIYDASLSTASTFILRNSVSGQPFGTLTGLTSGATRTINSQTAIGGQTNVSAFTTAETKAPDGSFNACLVTPTTSGSQIRNITKRFITSTSGTYTFSIFFKNKNITNDLVAIYIGNDTSLSNVVANFVLSTKTFSSVGQTGGWTGSVGYQDYSNGWGRIWVTATTTSGSHTFLDGSLWIGGYQGTNLTVGSLYAWGGQIEIQPWVSSYIPTTTSTVGRGSDLASMSGSNFSSWYNQTEGTVISNYIMTVPNTSYSNHADFAIFNATGSNRIVGWANDYKVALTSIITNNTNVYTPVGNAIAPITNLPVKKALSLKEKNMNTCANGNLYTIGAFLVGYQVSLPNDFTYMYLGAEGVFASGLNGTLARFTYYPKALPPNQLQLLTK